MEHFVLSRFWSRIWAFLIDAILLGTVGTIILWMAMPFFLKIGGWGRLLGWPIALLYFGICNSRLAGGQTIGKRLLRIEVVDTFGAPVSVTTSFKRTFVFTGAYFLVGAPFFGFSSIPFTIIQALLVLINIGIFLYYIFNRETRQSLHDLAAGTYVVEVMRQEYEPEPRYVPTKKPLYIWLGTATVLLLVGGFFYVRNRQVVDFAQEIREEMEKLPQVQKVNEMSFNTQYYASSKSGTGSNSYYSLKIETSVPLRQQAHEKETLQLVRAIAQKFLASSFVKRDDEVMVIFLSNVADIGIAQSETGAAEAHTIAEWRAFAESQN